MEKAEHKLGLRFFSEVPRELRHELPPSFLPIEVAAGHNEIPNECLFSH